MYQKFRCELRGDFHDARDELVTILEDPFFDEDRDEIKEAFMSVYRGLRHTVPANDKDMGSVCAVIEDSLRPALARASEIEDDEVRVYVNAIFREITGIRLGLKQKIRSFMENESLWDSIDYCDNGTVIGEVREVISAYLGLPVDVPEVDSPEFIEFRDRLIGLSSRDVRIFFGLDRLFRDAEERERFECVAEVVDLAFPEYGVREELESKRCFIKWVGDALHENVKQAALRAFGIPLVAPEKDSKEWHRVRDLILKIKHPDFIGEDKMDCGGAIRNHDRSCFDVLSEVYGDDYDLSDKLLAKKNAPRKYRWRSREETLANVREELGSYASIRSPENSAGTTRWWTRIYNLALTSRDFIGLHQLGGGTNKNPYFSSHIDLILEAFPDVGLRRWHFSRVGRRLIGLRIDRGLDVAPDFDDLQIARDIIANPENAYAIVRSNFETYKTRGSQFLDYEMYLAIKIYKFIDHVNTMGTLTPVNLRALWTITSEQVFSLVKYRFTRKGGDIKGLISPKHLPVVVQ